MLHDNEVMEFGGSTIVNWTPFTIEELEEFVRQRNKDLKDMADRCGRCGCLRCVCGTDRDLMSVPILGPGETVTFNFPGPFTEEELDALREERDKDLKDMDKKETNPKDALGIKKVPISTVSNAVMMELGLAMMEGALKYGRHNYRISGVRGSVYWDALWRHMTAWWEFGQDHDPDSGVHHITKAIACLMVLRDSQLFGNWVDDRPPPMPIKLLAEYNKLAVLLIEKYPNPKRALTKDDVIKNDS